ncbi:invasion associated locus B family protein [Octadecabacter sp.]|nr:invasion associated locus B family protein [Octadecabacter sp.]
MTLFQKSIAAMTATLLAGALALPLAAQEDTLPADAPLATVDEGFSVGEPVDDNGNPIAAEQQAPQVGEQYLSEVFNDWAIRCLKTEDGSDPCQMYQLLSDGEGNDVAEVAIVTLPAGGQVAAGATIVVPLETLLTQQITLRVDGGQARRFPFDFCNVGGCVTRVGLSADDIALFRRGAEATLTLVPAAAPDQQVTVTMSLSGFTAAYDAVAQ